MKNLGKYLYILPITVFGLMHFAAADMMSSMVPNWLPFPAVWVYLTGLSFIAATVALIIDKKAKLALTLLGVELVLFVLLMHIPAVMGGNQMAVSMILKDLSMGGAAFYIASGLKN